MTIQHDNNEAVVDIATVKLSLEGLNQLQNSSFKEGLDYWFYYNDFAHLPWHIKNLFLQVWFENGWLGVGLFLALLGLLVRSNLERRAHDSLNPVYTSAVLILCFFGFFGSPLDSARVSWMFYFLLCAGLVQLRVVKPEKESKFAISGSQKRA
jgi:O-antigen ligase